VTGICGLGTPLIILATGSNSYNSPFGVVSYNLHGLNNGRSYLRELCDKPDVYIVAVQEHLIISNPSMISTPTLWASEPQLCVID